MGAFFPGADKLTDEELEESYGHLSDAELQEQFEKFFQFRSWDQIEIINEEWARRKGTRNT